MNPLNEERLALNQKFIDLVNEYLDTLESDELIDAKNLFKYIWYKEYMLVPKDYTKIF